MSASGTTPPPLLDVQALQAGYGPSPVLFGIDLSVGAAEIVGVLGRNGMGKTTLVRSIMGLVRPTAGRVRFAGADLRGLPPHRVARLGVALVPEGRQVFANLSVEEHLTAFRRPGHAAAQPWTVERVFALFPRLQARRHHMGNQLSGGEQQMLAIARALMTRPSLLIMDEPSEGLAPKIVESVGEQLHNLKGGGLSMLLVEQNYSLAIGLADLVYVLENGEVVFRGDPQELDGDEEVKRRYLGVGV